MAVVGAHNVLNVSKQQQQPDLGNYYYYTTLGGWVLALLELETRLLLRRSLHRRRVSKVAYPFF